jgi:3-oxo-5-alpha-steroid 4-dehydrogenase 3 / polyprenol reductase
VLPADVLSIAMFTAIIWAIRAFYLLSSVTILTVRFVPALASRFLAYGARSSSKSITPHPNERLAKQRGGTVGIQVLDYLATFTVPHSWFTHFYVLSVACSLTILSVFYYHVYNRHEAILTDANTGTAALCSHLMLIQGSRRLCECLYFTQDRTSPSNIATQPSKTASKPRDQTGQRASSRMWVGHYAIGMAFYVLTNLAIWIEQLDSKSTAETPFNLLNSETRVGFRTWRPLICILVFLLANVKQNLYHHYLSTLVKYTLPDKYAFRRLVAPHYTMECIIYVALAVLDAPLSSEHAGRPRISTPFNYTLLCGLIFVVVNLGVTADGTKKWQLQKFRDRASEIQARWKMIPWLF